MDRRKSKSEMLAKIATMKEELARKERKLKKSHRVAKIKEHVQQKLKEVNSFPGEGECKNKSDNMMMSDKNKCKVPFTTVCEDRSALAVTNETGDSSKASLTCSDGTFMSIEELETASDVIQSTPPNNLPILGSSSSLKDGFTYISLRHSGPRNTHCVGDLGNLVRKEQGEMSDNSTPVKAKPSSSNSLQIESEFISPSFKSQERKCSSLGRPDKRQQNDISNSQFLEILGISQSVTLTQKNEAKEANNRETVIPATRRQTKAAWTWSLAGTDNPISEPLLDQFVEASQSTTPSEPSPSHIQFQSSFQSDRAENSQAYFPCDYTELDDIPFSQFELTEDFLSENSSQLGLSQSHQKARRSSCRPLIKRKSPRISAIVHSSGSVTSDSSCVLAPAPSKSLYNSKRKAAAVLSVFQFLIDEAKRKSQADFVLPHSFQSLMSLKKDLHSSKIKHTVRGNGKSLDQQCETPHGMPDSSNSRLTATETIEDNSEVNKGKLNQEKYVEHIDTQASQCDSDRQEALTNDLQNSCFKDINHNRNGDIREKQTLCYCESNQICDNTCATRAVRCDNNETNGTHTLHCNNKDVDGGQIWNSTREGDLWEDEVSSSQTARINFNDFPIDKPSSPSCPSNVNQVPLYPDTSKAHTVGDLSHFEEKEDDDEDETNCSVIPSSFCDTPLSRAPKRKHSSLPSYYCEKPKSAKISGRELFNCRLSSDDHYLLSSYKDKDGPEEREGKEKLEERGGTLSSSFNTLHPETKEHLSSLSEKHTEKDLSTVSGKTEVYNQANLFSPKMSDFHRLSESRKLQASTSTPISTVKSRFRSTNQNLTSLQLSPNASIENSSLNQSTKLQQCNNQNVNGNQTDDCFPLEIVIEEKGSVGLCDNDDNLDDTLPSGQKILNIDVSHSTSISLLASPILKSPAADLSSSHISPWKKISRTLFTPLRILEQESNVSSSRNLLSPTFSQGKLSQRESLPRPVRHDLEARGSGAAFQFAGCFQSCSEDSVVQLLHCEVETDSSDAKAQVYLISVQASALTFWNQDTDGYGWIPQLDWRLSSSIHILEACSLPPVLNKIGIAAYGWEQNQFFATVFVYDISDDVTYRFNLPIVEESMGFRNLRGIYLCCTASCGLLLGISFSKDHTIRSVAFQEDIKGVASTRLFEANRGTLQALSCCPQLPKACFGLTGDQRIEIWNIDMGLVLKSIQMPTALPCLTGLLGVTAIKGLLLLTVSWRSEKCDCGGMILLNPVTGKAFKYSQYQNPSSGWKSVQSMKILDKYVVAVGSSGSVCWWNHMRGTVIGHRKSNSASCATLMGAASLFVGEVQGCVHIYSRER